WGDWGSPRRTEDTLAPPVTDGAIFDLGAGDFPTIIYQLAHPTRTFVVEVFTAPTVAGGPLGKNWHRAIKAEYLGRNAAQTNVFGFVFDGTTTNGNKTNTLPPGDYVLVLTVLQPLGDESNPRSVETWQSPTFKIVRPAS